MLWPPIVVEAALVARRGQKRPPHQRSACALPVWLITTRTLSGTVPEKTGNRTPYIAPRNTYRTSDGKWVAISGSSGAIASRV